MKQYTRSHKLCELRIEDINKTVNLSGWVHRRRDHGGLIFIDLRDKYGITQVVFDPKVNEKAHSEAHKLRSEWVISLEGKVISRAEGMANPKMKTGEIEIEVESLQILSEAKTPPFSISDEEDDTNDELKLKYRYLDLRRGKLINNLHVRHQVMQVVRNFLDQENFTEVSTPLLCKSTPEGARDYLVPSRIYPGHFYALPQSPQIFKQILMIGGLDRYFQICSCFRDEDLRADRQPEFSQIDIEMSFESIDTLFEMVEGMFKKLYKKVKSFELEAPFKKLTYFECLDQYGTDKPDLRIPITLKSFNDLAQKSTFSIFLETLKNKGTIKGMKVPGGGDMSRKTIDNYTSFVAKFNVQGLAWMKFKDNQLQSSIVKFFDENLQQEIIKHFELVEGDILFFVANTLDIVNQAMDHLRRHIAKERDLIDKSKPAFLWVTDFPLFVRGDEGQLEACHHPFTACHPEDNHLLDSDPTKARSMSYDLVLNGYEIASGSERIYSSSIQKKIFSLLKLSEQEISQKFGFFVEALNYGTPPHLGIALGLDRVLMILLDTDNIRDVIAFPKTQKASDLMQEAPSVVESNQLNELRLSIKK